MVKLWNSGAYLVNGTELIADDKNHEARLLRLWADVRIRRRQRRAPWPAAFLSLTIRPAI